MVRFGLLRISDFEVRVDVRARTNLHALRAGQTSRIVEDRAIALGLDVHHANSAALTRIRTGAAANAQAPVNHVGQCCQPAAEGKRKQERSHHLAGAALTKMLIREYWYLYLALDSRERLLLARTIMFTFIQPFPIHFRP